MKEQKKTKKEYSQEYVLLWLSETNMSDRVATYEVYYLNSNKSIETKFD